MKYIITDRGEVRVGSEAVFHADIAEGVKGSICGAGHYEVEGEEVRIWGSSIGFRMQSKPEDLAPLEDYLREERRKNEGITP